MLLPKELLNPPPKALPPNGLDAPPICPKGEDPLAALPEPKSEGVFDLEDAEAPNGEGEAEALANEVSGLAPAAMKGEAEAAANPERPELLKADSDVAGLSATGALVSSDVLPLAVVFASWAAHVSIQAGGIQHSSRGGLWIFSPGSRQP